MNLNIVLRLLGSVSLLIGGFMLFSLPWASPLIGRHTLVSATSADMERQGLVALLVSMLISFSVAAILFWWGGKLRGPTKLFRKEAMAVVGLSWILATILGALPYRFAGVRRGPAIRVFATDSTILVAEERWNFFYSWTRHGSLDPDGLAVLRAALTGGAKGLSSADLIQKSQVATAVEVFHRLQRDSRWSGLLIGPGDDSQPAPADRALNYRVRWVVMNIWDCLFESQSGFSTTGATVISDVEDPNLVPHCILFWRSSTHFLGGLGIIVLFVVLLGQGSAGKAMMRAEITGPTKEGTAARIQHTAWLFAGIYVALNLVLIVILMALGMNLFDASCHAFGTMATGGFSSYNASVGRFHSPAIEYAITAFMILAGSNFGVLLLALTRRIGNLIGDVEWQTYIGIIFVATALIAVMGLANGTSKFDSVGAAVRYSLFQVVSILTTTGFGTADFDKWGHFVRSIMLVLMFIGGCAGSTGGGVKVIRVVLLFKILRLELERAFHPRVVRSLRVGGKPIEDEHLPRNILVYFALIGILFVASSLLVIGLESENVWGPNAGHKMIDSASAVAATLNNIGPGLGLVGASQNYSPFSGCTKMIFVWLMMLGRLEVFAILVLFAPSFWRKT